MITLDLSARGKLSIKDSILIDKIFPYVVNKYNDYIGSLVSANNIKESSLLLSLLSRDPRSTPFMSFLCKVELLEEKIRSDDLPNLIIVDYKDEKKIIKQVLDRSAIKNIKIKVKGHRMLWFVILKNILKTIYIIVNSMFWFKLFLSKKIPSNNIMFVDTFVFPYSFSEENVFVDRYYAGDYEYYNKNNLECWYAPTLVSVCWPTDYIKVAAAIKQCKDNFLMQESWLTMSDYFVSSKLSFSMPFSVSNITKYGKYDFTSYIKHELMGEMFASSLFKVICKYRFIYRLSQNKINIPLVLDWNENQNIDKALNLSFKQFYPNSLVVGYRGFIASSYMVSQIPTDYEYYAGVLPDVLAVISPICKQHLISSCSELTVDKAPAFRFKHLFKEMEPTIKNNRMIFIALPFSISDSIQILDIIISSDFFLDFDCIVNHHPVYSKEKFSSLVPEYNNNRFIHADKPINEYYSSMSILITGASSVCLEAISLGIYVAVLGSRYGITDNPIPSKFNEDAWSIFYSKKSLVDFIKSINSHNVVEDESNGLFYEQSQFLTNQRVEV